jgi:hypothetical protein
MKPSIVCGIEIEMEYNTKVTKIAKAAYHEDCNAKDEYEWVGDNFIAERDGSLGVYKFEAGDCVELVSVPFLVEDGMNIVKDFCSQFGGMVGKKLDEVICFNDSTGAHIHLSLLNPEKEGHTYIDLRDHIRHKFKGKPMFFRDIVGVSMLNKIKQRMVGRAKKALPKEAFEKWSNALVRSYAAPVQTDDDMFDDRRREWNATLLNRIEYRGMNLRGITTWAEFFSLYEILFSVIREVIDEEFESDKPFFNKSEVEVDSEQNIRKMLPEALVSYPIMPNLMIDEDNAVFLVGLEKARKRRRYEVEMPEIIALDMNEPPERNPNYFNPYEVYGAHESFDDDSNPDDEDDDGEGGN